LGLALNWSRRYVVFDMRLLAEWSAYVSVRDAAVVVDPTSVLCEGDSLGRSGGCRDGGIRTVKRERFLTSFFRGVCGGDDVGEEEEEVCPGEGGCCCSMEGRGVDSRNVKMSAIPLSR